MPASDCNWSAECESTPPDAARAGVIEVGANGLDLLAPRTRGSFRGFLPAETVAALRASAASGAGLTLVGPAPSTSAFSRAAPWLLLGTLALLALRNSR